MGSVATVCAKLPSASVQVAENLSDVDRALALLAGSHPAQLRAVIGSMPALARQHGRAACAALLAPLAAQLAVMEGDAQARTALALPGPVMCM